MVDHIGLKIINLGVAKLSNRHAKSGPMSEAILRLKRLLLVGLTCVSRLDLNHFPSQYD